MSATQYIARLTFPNGVACNFAHWETDSGHVPTVLQMMQDVLETGGVDGIRYMDNHRKPQLFTASTLEDFPNWATALAQATNYELCRWLYGSLIVITGGVTQAIGVVKVVNVRSPDGPKPRPRAGALVGYGASTPSAAFIDAIWDMHIAGP
jgi:hypothetical protein